MTGLTTRTEELRNILAPLTGEARGGYHSGRLDMATREWCLGWHVAGQDQSSVVSTKEASLSQPPAAAPTAAIPDTASDAPLTSIRRDAHAAHLGGSDPLIREPPHVTPYGAPILINSGPPQSCHDAMGSSEAADGFAAPVAVA